MTVSLSAVEQGELGSSREGRASAALQDVPAPRLPGPREPLDETSGVFPQTEAHQQHPGQARPCKWIHADTRARQK